MTGKEQLDVIIRGTTLVMSMSGFASIVWLLTNADLPLLVAIGIIWPAFVLIWVAMLAAEEDD